MRPILVLAFAALSLAPRAMAADVQSWRESVDRLSADIVATHPAPFARVGEVEFRRQAEALKSNLGSLSEEQRLVGVMRLVALLGDGHSQAQPNGPQFRSWYPIRLYEFEDGIFVTAAHTAVRDLAGAQVLSIGGKPALEAVNMARDLMGADNDFDRKERLYAVHNAAVMKGLGLAAADGNLAMTLRLRSGQTVRRSIPAVADGPQDFSWIFRPEYAGAFGPPEAWISAFRGLSAADLRTRDDSRPLHLRSRRARFATPLPERNAYYIQVNTVGSVQEGESFQQFFRRVLADVDRARPKHLILDMRQNFGGDGSTARAVVKEFLARSANPPWQNFYLLTGRRTFSAGVNMTNELIKYLSPTIVGEPMGAPANFYGDANPLAYDAIGMRAFVSHERHQGGNSNDLRRFIPVDVPARWRFSDYAAGRDPAVDPILEGQEMRSVAAIAAAEGADAAFRVMSERDRAADPTWAKPSEVDLRMVSWDLDGAGLRDEAIAVAELNTRANPAEWRTWFNLGNLLRDAGRQADAIEQYRRSVALNDPTNFNAERLKAQIAEFEAQSGGTRTN